jgi:hypothetical protein
MRVRIRHLSDLSTFFARIQESLPTTASEFVLTVFFISKLKALTFSLLIGKGKLLKFPLFFHLPTCFTQEWTRTPRAISLLCHLARLSPSIISHVYFAWRKKKNVVLYSSFPARDSLGLSSYMSASQLLGLSPRPHYCSFPSIIYRVYFAWRKRKAHVFNASCSFC